MVELELLFASAPLGKKRGWHKSQICSMLVIAK